MATLITKEPQIYYPDSDGKPMAENTIQFRWITTIKGNLDVLFHSRPDIFVAGDNFWYPVKGEPKICVAPDVYVVFGRPKRDRGSYKQWEENNIPLSAVFEVLSPSNTFGELLGKFEFYQKHGVQEYYIIATEPRSVLEVFIRQEDQLKACDPGREWISPLLGVRFVSTETSIELLHPDGKPFLTFVELGELQRQTELDLENERRRAESERQRAELERQRAESEKQRVVKFAAKLRELGIDPDSV
jgi:Uma2 family endonuclease